MEGTLDITQYNLVLTDPILSRESLLDRLRFSTFQLKSFQLQMEETQFKHVELVLKPKNVSSFFFAACVV